MAFAGFPTELASSRSSNGPWISGVPGYVDGLEHLFEETEDILAPFISRVVAEYQRLLEEQLHSDPEWADHSDQVTVGWDGNEFVFYFHGTEEEVEEMRNLEWGFDGPIHSLTRKTVIDHEADINKFATDTLVEEVGLDG